MVSDPAERAMLDGRAVIVKRLKTVPLEAVVRGYVIGSGWKDYQKTGAISGIKLPAGLKQAAKLPQTLFTPSTKAAIGDKDETISFEQAANIVGADIAARVRDTAIALYEFASKHARERGIIIADTKFEFAQGRRRLADAHRRSADARLLAFLAGGHLAGRHEPALLRQAVRARLSRDARLEQDSARGRSCRRKSSPARARSTWKRLHTRASTDVNRVSRPTPDARVQLARAIGQRRGSGLQDDRRLDLVEMPVAHGGHVAPARARRHGLGPEFLAAPRTEDHLGRAARHFERIGDDAILAQRLARQLRKHIVAAGDADELRHPADAGDLRLVPFLEIHARPARETRGARRTASIPALELVRRAPRLSPNNPPSPPSVAIMRRISATLR